MRTASTRQIAILAFVLVSALASNSGAAEQARPQPPSPPAPGASAGAGSLPDVVGIAPRMFIGDAYNLLKAYDRGGGVTVAKVIVQALGPKPVVHALQTATQGGDTITVRVTLPPEKQVVYEIQRIVLSENGKEGSAEVMVAALRKKYGPELRLLQGGNWSMDWRFDEQGRPAAASTVFCERHYFWGASETIASAAPGSVGSAPVGAGPSGFGFDPKYAKEPCKSLIYLNAVIDVVPTGGVNLVTRVMLRLTDIPAENRGMLATIAIVDNAAAQQEKQRLEKANQQAPPKF